MLAAGRVCGQAVTLSCMPVSLAGGTVGEFLHLAEAGNVITVGDSCVVVVLLARAAEVPQVAKEIEAKDAINLRNVQAGMDLAEAPAPRLPHAVDQGA